MTTVIEDLENEDTSFDKRFQQTEAQLTLIRDWVYRVQYLISESRSTEGSVTFDAQQLSTDLFVSIQTTKKAIGDKRFEDVLNDPPIGWTLMGLVKSRKAGEIKAQYIKDSNYPVCAKELVRQKTLAYFTEKLEELTTAKENSQTQLNDLLTRQMSNTRRCFADDIKQKRKNLSFDEDQYDLYKKIFDDYLEDDNMNRGQGFYISRTQEFVKNFIFTNNYPSEYYYNVNRIWEEFISSSSEVLKCLFWKEGDPIPYGYKVSRYYRLS